MNSFMSPRRRVAVTLKQRHKHERRFRIMAFAATSVGLIFLVVLFGSITMAGFSAFKQTYVRLTVFFDPAILSPKGTLDPRELRRADYRGLLKRSLGAHFPDVTERRAKRDLYRLVSNGAAFHLRDLVLKDAGIIGKTMPVWVTASDDVDMIVKRKVSRDAAPGVRRISDRQLGWIERLGRGGRIKARFNSNFFFSGDSREPELAGIAVAVIGSIFSVVVCLVLAVPLGVMTALYLEELAPRNRWTALLEVNINNLAAVPSIIFGLLGLAVFLNFFGLPRSAPLAGGMVLALMTLPTIIIATRAALAAVPPSVREAALALGASPIQAIFHHVVPLAAPGILTGTIISTARALGETAPLLMIGMVAFIVDVPKSILSPATALPVQVFLWADHPERAFEERTAAAILVLLVFTCLLNLIAVVLRNKFEKSR